MSKDEFSPEDRKYLIELLAAGDIAGLKAFKEHRDPEPIKYYCQVFDGINDEFLFDQYGIPLSLEEAEKFNNTNEDYENSNYLPQITAICICYSSVDQMQASLIEKYSDQASELRNRTTYLIPEIPDKEPG